jgi:lysozyme
VPKQTSALGRAALTRREGRIPHWYKDEAGIETGGVGHVRRPGEPNVFDDAQIDAWLVNGCRVAESCVNSRVVVDITQDQFDALVSFTFNIGTGGFISSTVLHKLNAGDMLGAALAFLMWDKTTDPHTGQLVVSDNLKARRLSEATQFYGSDPTVAA